MAIRWSDSGAASPSTAATTQILNSYISDIKTVGADSQAIGGWNGSGPYLIENNYLEAAGENVMFGGADPAVWSLVPSDITFRRNVLSKPLAWRQESWSVKNVFELKNARRVLVEGNVIENIWKAGQAGFAVQLTPRNQDGKAPWSVVEDVTFRDNIIRHAGSAFNLSGWDDLQASAQMRRVQIANNLVYDIDGAAWGGAGVFVQIGNSPADIVVEHNTIINSGTVVNVYGKKNGAPWVVDGFAFRDNLSRHNDYGIMGDGQSSGQGTLAAFFSRLVFEKNVLAGGVASRYPGGNYFPSVAEFNAAFVNLAADDLTLLPGSSFRSLGSGGTAVGADVSHVNATVAGVAGAASAAGSGVGTGSSAAGDRVVCRPDAPCGDAANYARRRR